MTHGPEHIRRTILYNILTALAVSSTNLESIIIVTSEIELVIIPYAIKQATRAILSSAGEKRATIALRIGLRRPVYGRGRAFIGNNIF